VAFGPSAARTRGGSREREKNAETVVAITRASCRHAMMVTPLAQRDIASRNNVWSNHTTAHGNPADAIG
jgi:hypothetical protein